MFKGIARLYREAYTGLPSQSWILFAVLLVHGFWIDVSSERNVHGSPLSTRGHDQMIRS
jgi:hypothetical protein